MLPTSIEASCLTTKYWLPCKSQWYLVRCTTLLRWNIGLVPFCLEYKTIQMWCRCRIVVYPWPTASKCRLNNWHYFPKCWKILYCASTSQSSCTAILTLLTTLFYYIWRNAVILTWGGGLPLHISDDDGSSTNLSKRRRDAEAEMLQWWKYQFHIDILKSQCAACHKETFN